MSNYQKTSLRNLKLFPVLLAVLYSVFSCTPQSKLTYIQDRNANDNLNVPASQYKFRSGDILHIRIMNDNGIDVIVNNNDTYRSTTRTGDAGDPQMFLYGYSINSRGEIHLPVIGMVNVEGLNIDEAHEIIKKRAEEYFVDATVAIKIVNFSVTVIGEVRNPGSFYIYDHDFTILDAIGLAGDLTDYGNRNVHVVRRTDEGVQFDRLDITDRNSLSSELYYLQPNDIVYVEPLLSKRFGFAQFPFSVFFSAITTTLLLLNYFI